MTKKIAVIVGSLREGSFNRMIADTLVSVAPSSLEFEMVKIDDLPFYNPDLDEGDAPAAWTTFRETMKGMDGVLFVTPEYNRSVPAVVKNALDVGSRPYGASIWDGKPAAVVTGSMGGIAGFGANHHLRQSLVFLNMPAMQQPELYLGAIHELFDENGALKSEETRAFLTSAMEAFAKWVEIHA